MSLLDRVRPASSLARSVGRPEEPTGWVVGAVAGLRAVGISLVVVVVPLLAGWATARHVTATWTQALRLACDGWLLAHHVTLTYPGGALGLTPWLLTLVPLVSAYRSGRRLGADPVLQQRVSGAVPWLRLAQALTALTGTYAACCLVVALLVRSHDVHAVLWQSAFWPAVLAGSAGLAGLVRAHPRTEDVRRAIAPHVPEAVRGAVRPAVLVLVAATAAGVLLVGLTLVTSGSRVLALHRALDPGSAGGVLLVLGQLAYLPVLAAWGLAWLAGPGFAVGAGTVVAPGSVQLGVLPVVPVLGALPGTPLDGGWWRLAALAVPVVAGLVGGWSAARRRGDDSPAPTLPAVALRALVAGCLAAAVLALVLVLSTGAIGPGRLAVTGPRLHLAVPALAAEVVAGALLGAALRRGAAGLRRRPSAVEPQPQP